MTKRVYLNTQDMYTFTIHVDLATDLIPEDMDFPAAINMVEPMALNTFVTVCERMRMFDHLGRTLLAKGWSMFVEPDGAVDFDVTCSVGDFILTIGSLPLIGSIEISDRDSILLDAKMADGRLYTEDQQAAQLLPQLRKNQ